LELIDIPLKRLARMRYVLLADLLEASPIKIHPKTSQIQETIRKCSLRTRRMSQLELMRPIPNTKNKRQRKCRLLPPQKRRFWQKEMVVENGLEAQETADFDFLIACHLKELDETVSKKIKVLYSY
jgi:hypothetical protein